jgi:O-antigen ligase
MFSEMFTLSMVFAFLTAFAERFFPQIKFLPDWMLTTMGSQDIFTVGEVAKARIGGLFSHSMLGDATAIAFVLQIYLAVRYRGRPFLRAYHWLVALIAIYVVSLTRNRGSLLVLVAGSAYFLWIYRREFRWPRAFAGIGLLFGLLLFGEITSARFQGDIGLLGRTFSTYLERGIPDTRVAIWTGLARVLFERPFLGYGPYFSLKLLGLKVHWPHNAFLFYWFTTGITGVVVFVILIVRILKRSWVGRGLDICRTPLSRGLAAVFHVGVVQFLLGQLRSDHQRGDVFVFLMWILFGLAIAARQVWDDQRRATPTTRPA